MATLTVTLESRGAVEPMADEREALTLWADYRAAHGLARAVAPLWTRPSSQPKTGKSARYTLALNLTAGALDGLCVVDRDCRATCVTAESWRARTGTVELSRRVRAGFLIDHPDAFGAVLRWDAMRVLRQHPDAMARPNCNSDVAWERVFPWLAELLPLYDYTKRVNRVGWIHSNYRTTYSATARTPEFRVRELTGRGDTVTMVFPVGKRDIPREWRGIPVVNGDITDDRYSDPAGVIVGLSWKGKLRGRVDSPLLSAVS